MNKNTLGELVYYTFEHMERTGLVRHGFSTRLGGVSDGSFESLNLGLSRGDDVQKVRENYGIFLNALEIDVGNIVLSAQTHTANVVKVGKEHRGNGFARENEFVDVDGLITDSAQTALVTFYADCVPIFLLDPVKKAVGLSHAGWKGTLNKIAEVSVKLMEAEFGSEPSDILAGIGPSIGQCCFETGDEVWWLFEGAGFSENVLKAENEKAYINLWAVNKEVLVKAGVSPENIEIAGLCTKCEPKLFYSHRVQGEKRGSMAAIMELL